MKKDFENEDCKLLWQAFKLTGNPYAWQIYHQKEQEARREKEERGRQFAIGGKSLKKARFQDFWHHITKNCFES